MTVTPYVDNVAMTGTTTDSQGRYGWASPLEVSGSYGAMVTFKVGSYNANESASWTSGALTQLDLHTGGSPTPTGVYVTNGIGATAVTTSTATLNGELVSAGGTNPRYISTGARLIKARPRQAGIKPPLAWGPGLQALLQAM